MDSLLHAPRISAGGTDITSVAIDEGVNTLLTLDDDFERVDRFVTEVILSPDEFRELNRYLEN